MAEWIALLDEFLDSVQERLVLERHRDDAIEMEVRETLAQWPRRGSGGSPPRPLRLPATSHLEAALDLARDEPTARVAASIRELAPSLQWTYGYPAHPRYPDLPSRVAFAPIAGPDDLYRSDHLLVGLTLIAPDTLYPSHFHPAIELYLPVGGAGLWSQGDQLAAVRRPGEVILHAENVRHSTEAKSHAVIAVYTWRGDLQSKAVFA
jgi:Dimethlysulfonioproprionate lyase